MKTMHQIESTLKAFPNIIKIIMVSIAFLGSVFWAGFALKDAEVNITNKITEEIKALDTKFIDKEIYELKEQIHQKDEQMQNMRLTSLEDTLDDIEFIE